MTENAGIRKIVKGTIAAMAAVLLFLGPSAAQAALINSSTAMFDYTTLLGYEVVTTNTLNFSPTGLAGWSVKNDKVILGANIISGVNSFSVFAPAGPGTVWNGYTYGTNEYGFIFQNGSAQNNGVVIELYYADAPSGYTLTKSSVQNYNGAGGWAGWSAPTGQVVTGGGYQFVQTGFTPLTSDIGTPGSVWPHHTFGANVAGWVVQGANTGGSGSQGYISVISFDAPAVPIPAAAWLLGTGIVGLAALRRKMQK